MAKTKTLYISELTGEVIYDEAQVVRITVHEHPDIEAPVEIVAAEGELKPLAGKAMSVVRLTLKPVNGRDETVTVAVDLFNKLATDEPMGKVLGEATPAVGLGRPAAVAASVKVDYSDPAYAANPKRGKVSEAEKATVAKHFDEINERLKRDGHRVLDLKDAQIVDRYGLHALAKERGIEPT